MSDINFRWDTIGKNKVDRAMLDALAKSCYVLQDDIREAQVVPRDIGTLQGEGFVVDDRHLRRGFVDLGFNTPYARRLYFHPEYNFQTDKNIHAQGLWLRHWLQGGMYQNRLAEIFEKVIKL